MGHKVNPIGMRIGITRGWKSNWFADKDYPFLLAEDIKLRKFVLKKLKRARVSDIIIERSPNLITLTIYTSQPGMVIGRSGAGTEELKSNLEKIVKKTIRLNVEEVKNPDLEASLVAYNIANQLEKRISYRRVCKQAISRTIKAGAKGVKVKVSGRLAGAEIARTENFGEGKMPLSTFRADIDYSYIPSRTNYGVIGVKVWIYKGEVFDVQHKSNTNSKTQIKHE